MYAVWKGLGQFGDFFFDLLDDFPAIAGGRLFQHDRRRRLAIEIGVNVIKLTAQLHGGDVSKLDHFAKSGAFDNDIFVLLRL